jgi:DNA-binding phage protein
MRKLSRDDVVRLLHAEVERAGNQTKWARKAGMVPSQVSMALTGDRLPSRKILKALNLRKVVMFERLPKRKRSPPRDGVRRRR